MTPLEIALDHLSHGRAPVPVPAGQKGPVITGWQNLRITPETASEYFGDAPANVGVLLGAASGNLVDVDLDDPLALELADELLPHTDAVFGRSSKPRSHRLYRVTSEAGRTIQHRWPDKSMILEYRANGVQTLFPGSVHPFGEPVRWDSQGEPSEMEEELLHGVVAEIARQCRAIKGVTEPGPNQSTKQPQSLRAVVGGSAVDRCRAYLSKAPDSISGQGGHDALLRAACECIRFGLDNAQSLDVLNWFNASKCSPPWNPKEIAHKLADALAKVQADSEVGIRNRFAQAGQVPHATADGHHQTPSAWEPDHLTQQINAERLIQILGGNARFDVNKGQWYLFDGRRFAEDHCGHVARAAKRVGRETWRFVKDGLAAVDFKTAFKHAVDSEKAAGISAMMKLAETEKGIPARTTDFDADPYLFNCDNGTIDLRTGKLRPHDRRDLLTRVAPIAYDPAAQCPLFVAFLRRITADNQVMIDYLRRLLGRCLTGDITEQELYFFVGEGANGKSVLIDTILDILGDYAGTAPESLLTVQFHNEHPTEIADLCGKRLVVASETEEGARLKVQLVKRLTGDARLKGRFMRQDFFEFDRTHKLIIVSNNKPLIRETKHAIWRRIRVVPFSVIIPESDQDIQLTQRLKAERPGILAWLVEGYRDWREGGMRTPDEVLMATRKYQNEQDPFGDYLNERCVTGPSDLRVTRNGLFTDYTSWCMRMGETSPLNRNTFFDHIRVLGGVVEGQWRQCGESTPVRGFTGLGLVRKTSAPQDEGE